MANTNPARGTRDFLPADVRKREYVIGIIKQVYESYGFEQLETPAVENIETLMGKYGEEGNQLIFRILKRGEKLDEILNPDKPQSADRNPQSLSDLALRYDLTVPLARVVANRKNDLPKFFKRYQIQPVWRADRPARGRYREFYQCDVDAIGSSSMVVEAELISAVSEILMKLGFNNYFVRINHRQLLAGILTSQRITGRQNEALVALDKLDKVGPDGVMKELRQLDLSQDSAEKLLYLFGQKQVATSNFGKRFYEAAVTAISKNELSKLQEHASMKEGVSKLEKVSDLLSDDIKKRVHIDPSLARGLSYYTGTIMEINVPDLAGSLGGGGRYDGLIGMFGKEQIPACGFSLGLERILVVMDERGMFPPEIAESAPADVMVTIWSEKTIAESLKLASELRSAGLRVTLYPEADKIGKQLKYADAIRVPFVCILGPTEIENRVAKIKNMLTGDEVTKTIAEIHDTIADFR